MRRRSKVRGAWAAMVVCVVWMGCNNSSGPPGGSPGATFDSGSFPEDSSMPTDDATMPDSMSTLDAAPEAGPETAAEAAVEAASEAGAADVSTLDVAAPDAADEGDATTLEASMPEAANDGPVATCQDGVQNGQETDVDCGGPACDAQMRVCQNGKHCLIGPDCQSKVCTGNVCQVPTCTDGQENGNETDVDCGGPLCDSQGHTCPDGDKCLVAADCQSLLCGTTCQFPSCHDGVQNGGETGIDCGNRSVTGCPTCPAGQGCSVAADCQSFDCKTNVCFPPTCSDGILNEGESDVDCGQVCVLKLCPSGKKCFTNLDCQSGVCQAGNTCM